LRALGLAANLIEGDTREAQTLAILTALAQLREELFSVGLRAEPLTAGPPSEPKPIQIKRDLAELRAQIQAAGLVPSGRQIID
jgi:hypothetical protein